MTSRWHPIAAVDDLPPGHVHQAMVDGHEFAVWRGDDGFVNVWDNRCLHRGVRLSIGSTDGAELRCAYHGWRYSNRTAGCTYIPAHPADSPARTVCNTTHPAVERYGLIWTTLSSSTQVETDGESGAEPRIVEALGNDDVLALRPLPISAPADVVVEALAGLTFPPLPGIEQDPPPTMTVDESAPLQLTLSSTVGDDRATVVFFVQPVDTDRCVVRGVRTAPPPPGQRIAVLRDHDTRLTNLRDRIEADLGPQPPWIDPALRSQPRRAAPAPMRAGRREAPVRVRVRRKWPTAVDIMAVELESLSGQLPTFQPGAHIDLHLPNGLVRQYSLTNGPGELDRYRIAVKLEPESRGGSRFVHESLAEGDELSISEPRPNFPLRRDAVRTVLVAGGIGVTPLLAMAQTLHRTKIGPGGELDFELHYFARGEQHLALPEVRAELGPAVVAHLGLRPDATGEALRSILDGYEPTHHVYICGPGPMLEATRSIAREQGWPDEAVHFEYFANATPLDLTSSFRINLARSAVTLDVPAGRTILDVLNEADIPVPSSCEQGACGTCVVTVLDGTPDHQDVHLDDAERARGDRIMTCVSRALSDTLTLDL